MNITLIEELARKIQYEDFRSSMIRKEAQTRTSLIDRMLEALGYDVRDHEVCSIEDNAAFRKQGGQKVDYSLFKNGNLVAIVEAKAFETSLENSTITSKLSDYFKNKKLDEKQNCRFFAMLSNGLEYRFFADLNKENLLDTEPFFIFNLKDYTSQDLKTLQMFSYDKIDREKVWEWGKILRAIENNVINLSPDFAKFVIEKSLLTNQKKTEKLVQEYIPEIKKAFEYVNSKIYKNQSIESKPHKTSKPDENLNPIQKGKVQAFWEKSIIEALSSSSQTLKAEEIWEKIQAKYPKEQIPTTNSNPVKRVSEQCLYKIENIKAIGKNPSKFILKTTSWTEEEILERYNSDIVKLYQDIKTDIMKLGNVNINPTKPYISFKINDKNFVGLILQQSKIRVFFTPRVSEFNDPAKRLIDTSAKNTGNGNTEFNYETSEDKDYLLSLIRQSYQIRS
ncbi:type I restriction endonuclease [Helicobacter cappadocius]|uniref:Type I restriction endonuclease n=1 Tax=Helicobacter cappadocius TaxID=3063998 RepID=A0ABT8Z159_9HELI|nr:type I restriction endonuclease [Helicobacter sp. faydin-H75]MDO7252348.1 type I restriction endonuclease [Helicobacter sp. faydin-H75]